MEVITIPHKLVHLNKYIQAERSNRFFAAKIKREMHELIVPYCHGFTFSGFPVDISFTWYVKPNRGRYPDPDNLSFAQKYCLDSLVEAGCIPDDTYKYIKSIKHEFIWGADEDKVEIRA